MFQYDNDFLNSIANSFIYSKYSGQFLEMTLCNSETLVTRDQPYLFATIFKRLIYVCFQLFISMNENQLKLH